MTTDDVVWSHDAYVDRQPPNPAAVTMATYVESVEATDESTILIHLNRPTAFQSREIGFWPISSRAYYESVGEDEFRRTGMGTGPFRITDNRIGELTEMEANSHYWEPDRAAKVAKLRLLLVPELTTRIAQLQTEEVDIIEGVADPRARQLEETDGLKRGLPHGPTSGSERHSPFRLTRKR